MTPNSSVGCGRFFFGSAKEGNSRKKASRIPPQPGSPGSSKDFRHYTPDDDYRSIDWRLYARLDRLYVRLYEEVQEFHVHILVDTAFPYRCFAHWLLPRPAARRGAFAYLGLIGQHRVSLYRMADRIIGLPPERAGQYPAHHRLRQTFCLAE
ncbi:MAG: DUF58 domain-containing protein [Verrucomicrobiales bacterium]